MLNLQHTISVLVLFTGAYANECTIKIDPSNQKKYVTQYVINAPLAKEYHLRAVHTVQSITNTPICDELGQGDELSQKDAYFVTDMADHDGLGSGHVILTTKRGEKIFLRTVSSSHRVPGRELADELVTGELTGGTGPFEGITGQYQSKNTFDWKHRKKIISQEQTLTLIKK